MIAPLVQRTRTAPATDCLVQGEHRGTCTRAIQPEMGMGATHSGARYPGDEADGVRAAGDGDQETGSARGCVERYCAVNCRGGSGTAPDTRVHLAQSQGTEATADTADELG